MFYTIRNKTCTNASKDGGRKRERDTQREKKKQNAQPETDTHQTE